MFVVWYYISFNSRPLNLAFCSGVKDGQFTVLQLVEALGLSLTSSQAPTRARGVQLLSEVLKECYGELTEREGTPLLLCFVKNVCLTVLYF
uniref:MMS19 nucleotide excision repair protein n=1 Tax=Stegastes partitus TaxID=144197 RepID=A0A3B5B5M2_9TELE